MRKTLGVCLLVLLLTGPASAGIMQNDAPAAAPAQQATAVQGPTGGEMPNGYIQNEAPGGLTQIALDLLTLLPSLL